MFTTNFEQLEQLYSKTPMSKAPFSLPFLPASVANPFFQDITQHSHSLGKATVLKISKPFCFNFCNFTLSQSAGKLLEKYLCGGKFK